MKRRIPFAVSLALLPALGWGQEVEYYHLDALGSVRAVTDASGEILVRHDYEPFGEEWEGEESRDTRRFTGKERDSESGLDYFGARYYVSVVGRFTSVDPVMEVKANLVNPQRWNRYAYALNNPLRYVDPTGRVVTLANLSTQQQASLLAGLNAIVGNVYSVDSFGNLELGQAAAGASGIGTNFLNDVIASGTTYSVVAVSGKQVTFAQADASTNTVRLDFDDFNRINYGKVNPAAFNLGTNLIHELVHLHLGLKDPASGRQQRTTTGPTVDFVNLIRDERGLPTRGPGYAATKGGLFRTSIRIGFQGVDPANWSKVRHVKFKPE